MATKKEGTKGQNSTRRGLKATATVTPGGSQKYGTKRTLKARQGVRDTKRG